MLKKTAKNDINLIIIGSLFILFVMIIGIVSSTSILKQETINNHMSILKVNTEFLAEKLNQNMNSTEVIIENISSIINLNDSEIITNQKLLNTLYKFPYIRSINILDKQNIIYTTNEFNKKLYIDDINFYPKPIFDDYILRISYPWIGRDLFSGTNILDMEGSINIKSSFIPILKKTFIEGKEFSVLITLNSDYLLNIFKAINKTNTKFEIELLRMDRVILLSTSSSKKLGKVEEKRLFLEKAIEVNTYTGIQNKNNEKFISSYSLTKDFPLIIGVHLDYEKSLLSWNEKSYKFYIISISIIVLSLFFVLMLILLYSKEKEKELKLEKEKVTANTKFKLLFENSHYLATVINSNGEINDINKKGLTFIGKNINQVKGKKFWSLNCWQNDEKSKIKHMIFKYNKHLNKEYELNALDKFQQQKVLELIITKISNGETVQLILLGIDVTLKKEREKKLQQSYTVFNNTRDGIMITDKYTNIIDINKSFELITGYTKKEILNKNTRILKSNIHNEIFYNTMWSDLENHGYWEGEIINRKKDGGYYTEWLTINTIYSNSMEILNYIGIFSDITEQKEKEKILKEKENLLFQQSKMASMGEMIENIAHQWRQPLSVISTAATGMKMSKELGISIEKDEIITLDNINNTTQFLSQTIEDFRDFLKTDKELKVFDLNNALNSAVKLVSSKFKNREITINLEGPLVNIYGLKNEFIQVIMNILSNSKDAFENSTISNKYVFINYKEEKNYIFIEIKDNAGGIPYNIIDKIFEPYFTTKHQSQGTGIGLYMSTEIIRNHMKGTLVVKNDVYQYENIEYVGASFEIKIPK